MDEGTVGQGYLPDIVHEAVKKPVRVLIVDDSAFMRVALSRMVATDPELSVVGTAATGNDALQRIAALDPDVITLDLQMPGLDGMETLRRIMAQFPRPVIVVSAFTLENAEATFNALAAGAFDYVPKMLCAASLDVLHLRDSLISKIKAAAESRQAKCILEGLGKEGLGKIHGLRKTSQPAQTGCAPEGHAAPAVVAIGVSTGGPRALQEILPLLPRDLPAAILLVQHMPAGFTGPLASRLNNLCQMSVCEGAHGQRVQPGIVFMAPSGLHMTVAGGINGEISICLSRLPQNQLHVPSINVMMESVASTFRAQAMGVIMTGMGADGAEGMKAIQKAGGWTVGQDELTCAVYGMPRVCAEMGVLQRVVSLSQIPYEILRATRYHEVNAG